MKKISVLAIFAALTSVTDAHAAYCDSKFRAEVIVGLDLIGALETFSKI